MSKFFSKYSKLIVAAVGIATIVGNDYLGAQFGPADEIVDALFGLLTLFGIERVPQTPSV